MSRDPCEVTRLPAHWTNGGTAGAIRQSRSAPYMPTGKQWCNADSVVRYGVARYVPQHPLPTGCGTLQNPFSAICELCCASAMAITAAPSSRQAVSSRLSCHLSGVDTATLPAIAIPAPHSAVLPAGYILYFMLPITQRRCVPMLKLYARFTLHVTSRGKLIVAHVEGAGVVGVHSIDTDGSDADMRTRSVFTDREGGPYG